MSPFSQAQSRPDEHRQLSLRVTLLAIIGFLNLLIAAQAAYHAWESYVNLRQAADVRVISAVMDRLYEAEKSLSLERGAALSILYTPPGETDELMEELRTARASADKALYAVEDTQRGSILAPKLPPLSAQVRADIAAFADLRHALDAAVEKPVAARPTDLSSKIFSAANRLIDDIDMLMEAYSGPYLSDNPSIARRMRFARTAWSITEYAGREYALLGRLIAEGKYPNRQEERDLLIWQGRIEYGWEMLRGFISTTSWGDSLKPHLEEAKTQYFMTFEQIKGIFAGSDTSRKKPVYPISADMWLSLAAQSVDSLHAMMDSVLHQNQIYVESFKTDAETNIWWSLLLFTFAVALSFYSWRVITRRVIGPVNSMADALYRSARGEPYEMPDIAYGNDEIGKLVSVLQLVQENSRQLQEERDKAQAANIAKSEFLANMSHEIRTPMNVVLGLANILAMSEPLTAKQQEFIKTLRMSAESLLSIINDLLDFSKIETGGFELENIPFSLSELVDEVFTLMSVKAKESGLAISVDTAAVDGKEYFGDPTRLRQVLTNLCSNAVKFTTKGEIKLVVLAHESMAEGVDDVFIQVIDTGVGIPPEKVQVIFDKFTQADSSISRKFGGTGLGLAIAKTFVEMMDGTITVDSVVDRGSTFTVYLPMVQRHELAAAKKTEEGNGSRRTKHRAAEGRRILLVEDYAPNALVAGVFLEQFGYEYDTAENGLIALEKFGRQPYYAILMDVQMQVMDGYQATRAIRKIERETGQKRIKIIGMTAYALPADRDRCLEAGMDDYLAKPFRPEDLRKKLDA